FYMFRLVFMTFFGTHRMGAKRFGTFIESPRAMVAPLTILAMLAAVGGFMNIPILHGGQFFHHFLEPVFADSAHVLEHHAEHHSVGLELMMMGISVLIAVIGITIAYFFYIRRTDIPVALAQRFAGIHATLLNKYWIDEMYNTVFVNGTKTLGNVLWRFDHWVVDGIVNSVAFLTRLVSRLSMLFDGGVVDGLVNGAAALVDAMAAVLRRVQTGYVQNYGLVFVLGAFILLILAFL
ncbi:hypothetical protein JW905_09330, partial [bacterium]|nr:hypothetical protein [candidate division CSSED10-310 bacterium]